MCDQIRENIATFQREGSGWRFVRINHVKIFKGKYEPMGGRSYFPLPDFLKCKRAIINMKNEDNECFKWCITRALNPVDKNSEIISNKLIEQSKELNWENIEFPMKLKDIKKFEKQNPAISVNVFGYEERIEGVKDSGYCYIIRVSEKIKREKKCEVYINLLLIDDGNGKSHYFLIKSMSRLFSSQKSKRNGQKHFCFNCLNHFMSEKSVRKTPKVLHDK